MVEAAAVDAYNESELITVWYTVIEEKLAVPFEASVLGVAVRVDKVELTDNEQIVVRCRRGRRQRLVPILDLLRPTPRPAGSDCIDAFCRWVKSGSLG
ncbi:hypothetical protein EPN29_00785 [bacterium]|nr:MAG: hypothetical protein EPN29_00785 [bacterium]